MQTLHDTPAPSGTPRMGSPDPALELVVAVAANGVIGRHNALPWRLPADLRRFRALTTGHAIVMGRKTWESIGHALPQRQSIVITRQRDYVAMGAQTAPSLDAALALVRRPPPVYCIGGGDIFRVALARATRLHVTEIDADFTGDAFFPAIDCDEWQVIERESHPSGSAEVPFAFAFVTYARRA